MSITQQLEQDFIRALKEKREAEILALRQLKSAIKNAEIAKRPEKLTDEDVLKSLRSELKKRQDSIIDYEHGNRQDLADKEKAEVLLIQKYLPAEMTDEKLTELVKQAITKTNAVGPKDFGKVMGFVMKAAAGQADGNRVKAKVQEILK